MGASSRWWRIAFHDLVRQRVFGIAWGYEDCNDAARVGDFHVVVVAAIAHDDDFQLLLREPVDHDAKAAANDPALIVGGYDDRDHIGLNLSS